MVRNREILTLSRLLWLLDWREKGLYLLLHLLCVEVTDYDDTLLVGAIPTVIVVAKFLGLEVHNHIHCADR